MFPVSSPATQSVLDGHASAVMMLEAWSIEVGGPQLGAALARGAPRSATAAPPRPSATARSAPSALARHLRRTPVASPVIGPLACTLAPFSRFPDFSPGPLATRRARAPDQSHGPGRCDSLIPRNEAH